jgi:hypothetical protein
VRTGAIKIEVRLGRVELGSPAVAAIASLRPYTMSWSNVLDYMRPRDFWQLARACSERAGTVHFGCSMNWTMSTNGTCLLDFPDHTQRRELVEQCQQQMAEILSDGAVYPQMHKVLLTPPVDNVLNTSGFVLSQLIWKDWLQVLSSSERAGPLQIASAMPHKYNFLARQSTAISLTWTFDMN